MSQDSRKPAAPALDSDSSTRAASFWESRSVEQLAAEQGTMPLANASVLVGVGADLWGNDEEFEAFLSTMNNSQPPADE